MRLAALQRSQRQCFNMTSQCIAAYLSHAYIICQTLYYVKLRGTNYLMFRQTGFGPFRATKTSKASAGKREQLASRSLAATDRGGQI